MGLGALLFSFLLFDYLEKSFRIHISLQFFVFVISFFVNDTVLSKFLSEAFIYFTVYQRNQITFSYVSNFHFSKYLFAFIRTLPVWSLSNQCNIDVDWKNGIIYTLYRFPFYQLSALGTAGGVARLARIVSLTYMVSYSSPFVNAKV